MANPARGLLDREKRKEKCLACKTGSESIEATLRRRWILFAGFVVRGGYETAEVRDVWRIGGGRGCVGGQEKEWIHGVFPGRPQSLRYQRRPVEDCSPGRGAMAQDDGTRGGTFHGEMDRCRES